MGRYTFKDFIGAVILIIIFALIPLGVYLLTRQTVFFSKADTSYPSKVKISNILEDSFTVSWLTKTKTYGFITYSVDSNVRQDTKLTVFDDRDTDVRTARLTHYVTIRNLNPQTKYYFKIGSGGSLFDKNGVPYEVSTAPISSAPLPLTKNLSGKIMGKDGSVLSDAILYFTTPDGYLMSAIAKGENWTVPLNKARSGDLVEYKELDENTNLNLLIETGTLNNLQKTIPLNDVPEAYYFSL